MEKKNSNQNTKDSTKKNTSISNEAPDLEINKNASPVCFANSDEIREEYYLESKEDSKSEEKTKN